MTDAPLECHKIILPNCLQLEVAAGLNFIVTVVNTMPHLLLKSKRVRYSPVLAFKPSASRHKLL
jgi:hypothetical protein